MKSAYKTFNGFFGKKKNTPTSNWGAFSFFPNEVILMILFYLDPVTLAKASQFSKAFLKLACDNKLWNHFIDSTKLESISNSTLPDNHYKNIFVKHPNHVKKEYLYFTIYGQLSYTNDLLEKYKEKEHSVNNIHISNYFQSLIKSVKQRFKNKPVDPATLAKVSFILSIWNTFPTKWSLDYSNEDAALSMLRATLENCICQQEFFKKEAPHYKKPQPIPPDIFDLDCLYDIFQYIDSKPNIDNLKKLAKQLIDVKTKNDVMSLLEELKKKYYHIG